MTSSTVEQVRELQDQEADLVAMHVAALRVVDSTTGGGWGTFRVDGLRPEQLAELPDYIGRHVGQRLPRLFYDDDGQLQQGGGLLVRAEHTRFHPVRTMVDDHSGETRTWFRWDRELWDSEAAAAAEQTSQSMGRRSRLVRYAGRGLFALLALSEAYGMTTFARGVQHDSQLTKRHAPAAEIARAQAEVNEGLDSISYTAVAGGLFAAGLAGSVLRDVRRRQQPNRS